MARIIVIGAGMGGLAVAARLATRKHSVTVLEQSDTYGGKLGSFERDGFVFDTGPSLLTLPAVYRDLFLKTGRAPLEDCVDLQPLEPAFGYRWADGSAVAMPGAALVGAIAIHVAVLFGAGVGMRLAATNPAVEAFFTSRLPRVGAHLSRFAERSRETPIVAWGPVGAMVLGRLAQTFEYGLLASAVGISIGPLEALAVQGVNLVAAAVGVLMPGQLGSSEAIFALASETLGTDEASAMTIALAAHLCALGWAVIGLVLLLAWRASTPRVRAKR